MTTFSLLVLILNLSGFILAAPTASDNDGSGDASCETDGIVNWDYRHVPKNPKIIEIVEPLADAPAVQTKLCPDGWFIFGESCYMISSEQLAIDMAERSCHNLNTTLFVPDTMEEFNTIRLLAPLDKETWLGLTGSFCSQWQTKGGMNFEYLNHKLSGFDLMGSCEIKCFAHTNALSSSDQFTHFYDCTSEFYYICERNATLFSNLKRI